MDKLESEITEFSKARDWDKFHSPDNLAKCISIEAAELLECFQWSADFSDKEHVSEELADVMIYCLQMAHTLGVSPEEIIRDKMKKNAIKYPVEKGAKS